jgi:hypothetical protein
MSADEMVLLGCDAVSMGVFMIVVSLPSKLSSPR